MGNNHNSSSLSLELILLRLAVKVGALFIVGAVIYETYRKMSTNVLSATNSIEPISQTLDYDYYPNVTSTPTNTNFELDLLSALSLSAQDIITKIAQVATIGLGAAAMEVPTQMRETEVELVSPYILQDLTINEEKQEAFAATGISGVQAFTLTASGAPVLKASIQTYGNANACTIHPFDPTKVLVADSEAGLSIIDTSGASLRLLPRFNTTRFANSIFPIQGYQELIATATNEGIALYNITNVTNLEETYHLPSPPRNSRELKYTHSLVEIKPRLWGMIHGTYGVSLVNASNLFNMTITSTLYVPSDTRASFKAVIPLINNSDIVVTGFDNKKIIAIFNVSDPFNPYQVSSIDIPGTSIDIQPLIGSPHIYRVAIERYNPGVALLNLRNISAPVLTSFIPMPSPVVATIQSSRHINKIFAATQKSGVRTIELNQQPTLQLSGLQKLSEVDLLIPFAPASSMIANPGKPEQLITTGFFSGISQYDYNGTQLIGNTTTAEINNDFYSIPLEGHGNHYMVGRYNEIAIYNNAHQLIKTFTTNIDTTNALVQMTNNNNIVVLGGFGKIAFLDITDIHNPVILSTIENLTSSIQSLLSIDYNGEQLVNAVGYKGDYYIINASNVSKPAIISSHKTFIDPRSIQLVSSSDSQSQGPYIAISNVESGVLIFDISNPNKPVLISSVQTDSYSYSSVTVQNFHRQLLITNGVEGVAVANIDNITKPVLAVKQPTKIDAYSIAINPNYPDQLLVSTFDTIEIHRIQSIALWKSYFGKLSVGNRFVERLDISSVANGNTPCETLRPLIDTVQIKKIDLTDGIRRRTMPLWFEMDSDTLTMTGTPPREAAGHYALEVKFNATTVFNQNNQEYTAILRFEVEKSLDAIITETNVTWNNGTMSILPALSVTGSAPQLTLEMRAPADQVRYIIDNRFNKVIPSYAPETGQLFIRGTAEGLNYVLQNLRYISLNSNYSTGTISVKLTDSDINYPVMKDVDLSILRLNQIPSCSPVPIILPHEAGSSIQDTISRSHCHDPDDEFSYKLAGPLPRGLNFNEQSGSFFGEVPSAPGFYLVRINATDTHGIDTSFDVQFNITRTVNNPPILTRPFDSLDVTTGESKTIQLLISDFISDPDHDDMIITFSGLPQWLRINPQNITISSNNTNLENRTIELITNPTPSDTNSFSTLTGIINVQVNDTYGGVLYAQYPYRVSGESIMGLTLKWGSSALGVLGAILGLYKIRNKVYNVVAYNRYYMGNIELPITSHAPHGETMTSFQWHQSLTLESDSRSYVTHKIFSELSDEQRKQKIKDITSINISTILPESSSVLNFIPKVFNATLGRLLSKLGIQINPSYFTTRQVENDMPNWLLFDKNSGEFKVTDISHDGNVCLGAKTIIEVMKDDRIMEQIAFELKHDSHEHNADADTTSDAVILDMEAGLARPALLPVAHTPKSDEDRTTAPQTTSAKVLDAMAAESAPPLPRLQSLQTSTAVRHPLRVATLPPVPPPPARSNPLAPTGVKIKGRKSAKVAPSLTKKPESDDV